MLKEPVAHETTSGFKYTPVILGLALYRCGAHTGPHGLELTRTILFDVYLVHKFQFKTDDNKHRS